MAQINNGHDAQGAAPQVLTVGSPAIGEILADRYQVEEHLGDDTHGRQLFRGVDVVLRRPVTIVLRHPGGDQASEMLAAAVAASRVIHPHLVGVYDAIDEGERAYVVREWIDGVSLGDAVVDGPLDPARAVAIAYAVADAIAALHEAGVAHGNVHPQSVMIAQDGRVMLADARATDSTSEASDVRAIGGILYCALTGFWPHAEAGPAPLPDGIHDNGRLVAPSEVTGDVPAPLDELTMTLLDPQVQAAPAGTVTAELAVLTDPVLDEDLDRSGDHFSAFGDSAQPALANPAHRRRLIGAIGVLVVLALVGAIAALSFGNNSGNGDNSVSPSSNVTTASPAPGDPTKVALSSSNVRIVFGPGQGNRADSAGYQKAFDGNPGTYWQTDSYNDANMKSYHTGIGMLVNLGSPKRVSQVTLNMKRPGATVGLRYGDSDPGDSTAGDSTIDGAYRTLVDQQVMAGSTKIIKVTADTKTQYLLIWCTNLPAGADGGYQLEVGEIEVMVQ